MTTTSSPPFVQFGTMLIGSPESGARTSTLEDTQKMLDVLKAHKVHLLDSARMYGDGTSEEYLGKLKAEEQGFQIATKVFPLRNSPLRDALRAGRVNNDYTHSAKDVHDALDASLKALQTKKVDIYYLHSPDRKVPFEETLKAINEEYKAGHFERFGISNYTADDVRKMVDLCEKNGWVKPTVYQGMYSGINRSSETKLLPVLRKNNISFVAYSPLAGGFFTMKEDEAVGAGKRFDQNSAAGKMYRGLFWDEKYFKVLRTLRPLAEKHNVGMIELAIRWCQYHSALSGEHGDMLLLGSSSTNQLEANLTDIEKGPLPKELVDAMEDGWQTLKDTAFAMEENFG